MLVFYERHANKFSVSQGDWTKGEDIKLKQERLQLAIWESPWPEEMESFKKGWSLVAFLSWSFVKESNPSENGLSDYASQFS